MFGRLVGSPKKEFAHIKAVVIEWGALGDTAYVQPYFPGALKFLRDLTKKNIEIFVITPASHADSAAIFSKLKKADKNNDIVLKRENFIWVSDAKYAEFSQLHVKKAEIIKDILQRENYQNNEVLFISNVTGDLFNVVDLVKCEARYGSSAKDSPRWKEFYSNITREIPQFKSSSIDKNEYGSTSLLLKESKSDEDDQARCGCFGRRS